MLSTGRASNDSSGKLEPANKTARHLLVTGVTPGLTPKPNGGAMDHPSQNIAAQQQIALEYLTLARKAYTRSKDDRAYWATLARQYGLKWADIGDALGLSADGARGLVRTHRAVI